MKKKLPLGVRILLGFLSVILCFALFATTVTTILVADLSLLTSKGGLQKLIKDVIFPTSAPVHISAVILPGRTPVRLNDADTTSQDAIIDALYDMLQEQFGGELPIEKEAVKDLIDQSTMSDYISDKVSGIVSDVISGESTTTITTDEILDLVEENKALLENTFQVEITEEMLEEVGQYVEKMDIMDTVQQEVSNIVGLPSPVDPSDPNSTIGSNQTGSAMSLIDAILKGQIGEFGLAEALILVRFITSTSVLLSCIGACLLLCALLFLTNWGRPNAALRCCGIPILIAGILFLIPTVVAYAVPSLFLDKGIAGSAIRQVLVLAGTVSISVTALGLVLIIGGIVLGSILKKRAAKAAAAAEVPTEVTGEAPVAEAAVEAPAEEASAEEAVEEASAEEAVEETVPE